MSNTNNPLAAMLAQYENNNKPKFEKKSEKTYDLKNYFNVFLKEGVNSATKTIRVLPSSDGSSPFVEVHGHKAEVNGEYKTFACLKEEKGEACPFCEAREKLLATGEESKKELAKKYKARLMYVVKVIDRDNEAEGVKFWRFNHDFRKEGIYDKIVGVMNALKKNKDITDVEQGRDLVLTINRNQNNVPVVSAIGADDPSQLTEDSSKKEAWLSDVRTWEDVYSVKSYDYLKIIVMGDIPVWDKENKCWVAKVEGQTNTSSTTEAEVTIGLETVKSNVQAATPVSTPAPANTTAEEGDDLPF
jgi:hypothetical protein